ncbi:MAG: anthranilate/aminodeoxychorismate synthase component II [Deltaproteobacteria bacterium RIFCSPLOWO2_01_44_7]|nr:MAG: anthranilate/aminodeoxychorismate synthase component II [Deltaproteobacteria bacterium RIFCSPHIGHO2_01_FULL_43_49]OGQ16316.1 MAG: anthranilate/aminodeoxychorismate synthase component II [Deltaproteobacteria bacterium RIFCSPHIGHO2_02_FULL_44_53]OGQ29276.1 MAG: anthranilate/aminodeoxychorismate synthase component II [Deltaproteobacteria bacterium RIFCSPHIGHO2_12_FULL_44_21]OGQ32833.1 MAG: anthranilate/aminodeoxychorismate synthase component II [Deltaproteobacteria bacterium RIFCSPLOWO2_01_
MICLIDNYDSFTYNLYQALVVFNKEVQVVRNDQVTCEEILKWEPSHIVLSPGPKTPKEAGICLELIQKVKGEIPLLGVCLGHQAIAMAFGAQVIQAKQILHGKTSKIFHTGEGIFENVPNPFEATRYHSLAVSPEQFPECLKVLANTEDDEIMALAHREYPIVGVQFHPESVLTNVGSSLIRNFLAY